MHIKLRKQQKSYNIQDQISNVTYSYLERNNVANFGT